MENENQKKVKAENKEQLKNMLADIKTAFKAGNFAEVKVQAEKIKELDPKNHIVDKIVQKVEIIKKKQDVKAKAVKVKEYNTMLRKLYKEGDGRKLRDLAIELKEFDSENKTADKWMKRADKLEGRKAIKKDEKKVDKVEKMNTEAKSESAESQTPAPLTPVPASLIKDKPITATDTPVLKPLSKTPVSASLKPSAPIAPQPTVSKPVADASVKPVQTASAPAPDVPAKSEDTAKADAPKSAESKAKENTFTKMFGGSYKGNQGKKSIIDRIVAKTDKKDEDKKKITEKKATAAFQKVKKEKKPVNLLSFSRAFLNFTAAFIVLSGAFLYVEFLDTGNTFLSFAGVNSNTGSRLYSASEEIGEKKREEAILSKEIELYKGGYDDTALTTVDTLIEDRIDWPDIFAKINEVTNSVYELNDFFKYIEYNNYSFDAEKKAIRVTGTLSDPLGRNLTRLVELEEAFKYYPQDKENKNDPTQPYFTGFKEFTSFSKSLDQETGRYNSNFQLSFALNK